jgi:hypothetical protein
LKLKECPPVIVATIIFVAVVIMGLMSISSMGYPAGYGSGFLSVMTVTAIAAAIWKRFFVCNDSDRNSSSNVLYVLYFDMGNTKTAKKK